jgi:uncharacterized protein (DUF58 family)
VNLTPFATIAIVLTMAVGIVGQWSTSEVPWWRLFAGLIVLGLLCEFLVTRITPLRARATGDLRFFLGRKESVTLEFANDSWRRLKLEFQATPPDAIRCPRDIRALTLAPGLYAEAKLPVRSLWLGIHEWPTLPVRVTGPLGLARWSRTLPLAARLEVIPDTLGEAEKTTAIQVGGANPASALGGGLELHHLRDYRAGDPLNALDWKATARTSRLITRVFSEDQHLQVMILIDVGRTSRTQIDDVNQFSHYVNLAARLAEHCVANDDDVGFVAFADRPISALPPGRGIPAIRRLRRALAALEPLEVESDVLQAALYVRNLLRHRCLVPILTDLYERSSTSQLAQASRLLLPKHLPLVVGLVSEDVIELANLEAKTWLDPYRSLAGREYRRHVKASIARLAQLGAQALAARPRELDRRVLGQYDLLRRQRRV